MDEHLNDVASVRGGLPLIIPSPTQATLLVNHLDKIREGEILVMTRVIIMLATKEETIMAG